MTAITVAACAGKGPAPITKDSAENQASLRKLGGYIHCLEQAKHTFEVADRYRERYASQPPAATDVTPVQPSSDPQECTGDVLGAVVLEPRLPELDAAGRAYLDALTETYALTVGLHDAFDHASGHYNPAAGIALHPRLLAAFDHFDTAQSALFDQVYQLNHKIHADQLARRAQQEGRTLAVMIEELIVRAETLAPFASESSDRLDVIDVDAMTAAIVAVQTSLDEITAYASLHQKDAEDLVTGFWDLPKNAKAYVFAARQLAARAKDHLAYTDSEKVQILAHNEAAVVGTPAAMIDAYNHLLDVYTPAGIWPR